MSILRRSKTACVLATAGIVVAVSSTAVTSASAATTAPQAKYCVQVLDPLQPGQQTSRIAYQTCSTDPSAKSLVQPAAETELVKFWQNNGYEGLWDIVYGKEGKCDIDGYGLGDLTGVNANVGGISSYKLYNNCTASQQCTKVQYAGDCTTLLFGNQPLLHGEYNDHMYSGWVLHG